jgi:hypothetical protein
VAVLGLGLIASVALFEPALHTAPPFVYYAFYGGGAAAFLLATALVIWGRLGGSKVLFIIIAVGIGARLLLIHQVPTLSTDIFRYVWDGRVQMEGINPYRYVPADEALAYLRDPEIWPNINRVVKPTAYPPAAQVLFLLAATFGTETVMPVKLLFLVLDLLTMGGLMWLLRRSAQDPCRIILYAWNPLIIWEVGHSGHMDVAVMFFFTAALLAHSFQKSTLVGIALAAATLTKFFPAAAFPALYRRWDWRMPLAFGLTCVLGYVPYLGVGAKALGFLPGYIDEEGLASGERFFPLWLISRVAGLPTIAYLALVGLVLGSLGIYYLWRSTPADGESTVARRLGLLVTAALLASTPRWPWYYMALAPSLTLSFSFATLYLVVGASLLYSVFYPGIVANCDVIFPALLYVPVYLLLAYDSWLACPHRGGGAGLLGPDRRTAGGVESDDIGRRD